MGKIYRFLGMTVGVIQHELNDAERQVEVARLLRQTFAECELVRLVVDHHRVPERQRRETFRFLDRNVAQRRVFDQARHVAQLERPKLERIDPREL